MGKYYNISTDPTLGGSSASDSTVSSQRAVKDYVDEQIGTVGIGANKDLSNLTAMGEAHFANPALTNSSYTTNRILEIPQDIKLELNNGTLTLKAGSKVYVPNGFEADGTTPKFDIVTIENDIYAGGELGSFTDKWVFGYRNNGFYWEILSNCFSGSALPTQIGENRLGYNTTLNKFQVSTNGGAYIDDICSFPICIFSTNSGVITSIDQVFNGFGYIGSTVFVLPGVKGQYANGRNADGTCKSIVTTTTEVYTYTPYFGSTNVYNTYVWLRSVGTFVTSDKFYYDSDKNQIIYAQDNNAYTNICIAKFDWVNGKITSFDPYTVDSVVNSNEFYQLKDKAVTTDTAQTIRGVKTFSTGGTLQALRPLLMKENNENEGGQINFQRSNNSVLNGDPYIDLWKNSIRFIGTNSNNTLNITLQVDLENKQVLVPTPNPTANDSQAATTAWFRRPNCAVRTVIETYRSGENWYRVWSDGWIEQGGVITASYANAGQTINLLKPFTNTNYTINVSAFYAADLPDGGGSYGQSLITLRSTTSFGTAQTGSKVWYACGY